MNNREILVIALKFLGIELGFQSITPLTRAILIYTRVLPKNISITDIFFDSYSPFMGPIQIFLFVFYTLSAWYLFKNAKQLSLKVIKEEKIVGVTKEQMLELVMLFQGISALVYAAPALFIRVFQNSFLSENLGDLSKSLFIQYSSFMYIVEIIIGLVFIFKAQRIANWLYKKIPTKFWQ